MLLQLERQYLQADLAQVRTLLADMSPEEDPIEHFQFTHRLTELEEKLSAMPARIAQAPAAAALFFGGRPVVGSHGIKAAFSGEALDRFQKLVSQRFAAAEVGPLADRGRVPRSEDTQLLVTDVVHGSFGFVLQAAEPAVAVEGEQPDELSLKTVVDEVASTLSRMAAPDEALFESAAAEVDNRQLGELQKFFKLLDDEGASLRLVEGDRDFELDRSAISRARARVEALSIEEATEELVGQIVGWAEYSHRFELLPHGGGAVVMGTVSRAAMDRAVQEGINPLKQHYRISVKVREVRARQRQPRRAYTLLGFEPIAEPVDWMRNSRQQPL